MRLTKFSLTFLFILTQLWSADSSLLVNNNKGTKNLDFSKAVRTGDFHRLNDQIEWKNSLGEKSAELHDAAQFYLEQSQLPKEPAAGLQEEESGLQFPAGLNAWKNLVMYGSAGSSYFQRQADFGVTINGSSSATVDAGEEFDLELSFPAGTDSIRLDIVYDADADTVLDSTDLSLFDIRFVDDDLQGGAIWFYPDSADTAATINVDDFPYMGLTLIFNISNSTDTAQAYLTIDAVTGDNSISGYVSGTTSTYPSLVIFQGGEGPEAEYGWLTFSSVYQTFSFNYGDVAPNRISAMDVYNGVDTGTWMLASQAVASLDQSITLDLTQDASMSGTITEEDSDAGVAGLRISTVAQAAENLVFSYNFTSDSGTFELPLQGYTVLYDGFQVGHPDYQQAECDSDNETLYILPGDDLDFDCSIAPWPAFVEGTVTDLDGDPIPGITVRLELDNLDFVRNVRTNNGGFYRMGSLLGVGELCANPQGNPEFQPNCIFPLSINADLIEQDFTLDPWEAAVVVEVTDHETDDPIAGARVDVMVTPPQDGRRPRRLNTNEDGIAFIGLSNGTYRICAEQLDLGYQRECVNQVMVQDDTLNVAIELSGPEAFIEGYVFDSGDFTVVSGITILVAGGENQGVDGAQQFGTTDENGFYQVGVNNGNYIVCFLDFQNTYDDTCIGPIAAENGTTVVPIMYLEAVDYDGAIAGTVADQYDVGVAAFVVAADTSAGEDDAGFFFTTTNLSGEYHLPVMNGDYAMSASPFNEFYLPGIASGISVFDDTVTQDIETPALIRDAVIYGTVTDSNGSALEGANVISATWRGPDELLWFAEETDDSGDYEMRIPGFDDRVYWVFGQFGNEDDDEILVGSIDSLLITSGDTVEADLVLRPEVFNGRIYGTVTLLGEPLPAVEVTAQNYQSGRDFQSYTDEVGFFTLEVDYGEFEVCAHYWAYEDAECVVAQVSEEHSEMTIEIEYGAQVETLDNNRGNFRFTWGNDGSVTRGEWPAGSGRNYLAGGGLVTIGYMGDSVLAGGMIVESWEAVPETFEGILGWISRDIVDSGFEHGTGIEVSEAIFAPPGNQNFVVIYSEVTYPGDYAAMEGFRIGYFLDWNVAESPNGVGGADDDLTGMIDTLVSHPSLLTVMLPVKISYMMDDNGDQGASPGYVGMATFSGLNLMGGLNHVVINLGGDEPDTPEEAAEIFDVEEDSENPNTPGDYAVLQLSEPMSISAGDTLNLVTILMAADNPTVLVSMIQNILNNLINLSTDDESLIPTEFALHQNYPNPFNPVTTIQYDVPVGVIHELPLQLQIYDLQGRLVTTLVDRPHSPGRYTVRWDAGEMPSGMYFYRISTPEFTATKKLVLMK